MKAERRAKELVAARTTAQLLDMWDMTTVSNNPCVYSVREWLMDELEKRYPRQFNEWLDGEAKDETLREYIPA